MGLKELGPKIGLGSISFGSTELMNELLGVTPGSVTPFALLNHFKAGLVTNKRLIFGIDDSLLDLSPLHFHPLHNEATVVITHKNLLAFVKFCEFEPLFHKF